MTIICRRCHVGVQLNVILSMQIKAAVIKIQFSEMISITKLAAAEVMAFLASIPYDSCKIRAMSAHIRESKPENPKPQKLKSTSFRFGNITERGNIREGSPRRPLLESQIKSSRVTLERQLPTLLSLNTSMDPSKCESRSLSNPSILI